MNDCFYCGRILKRSGGTKANPNGRTRDHKVPIGRGGPKSKENVVWACVNCNAEKGILTLEEYRAVIAYRRGLLLKSEQFVIFPGEIQRPERIITVGELVKAKE